MSEKSLQKVLDRVAGDEKFADYVRREPIKALAEFDLSTVELFALTCADEDALRRLGGATEEDTSSVELAVFADAALVAFDEEAIGEFTGIDSVAASGKTSSVTSAGVTKCCWG